MRLLKCLMAISLVCLVVAPALADSKDPEECISDWNRWSEAIDSWYARLNNGWDNLNGSYDYAFDEFNYANSRARTEIYWQQCMEVTTITKSQVDKMNDGIHVLQRSARCGMSMSHIIRQRDNIVDLIDDYNAGRPVQSKLKVALEQHIDEAQKVHGSWECKPEGRMLTFLRNQQSWARNIMNQL